MPTDLPHTFGCPVVGVTFAPDYPQSLLTLRDSLEGQDLRGERPVVVLRRNPDNAFDPNAIEVHVPAASEFLLGHIPAETSARLAPLLDSGECWAGEVESVLVASDHEDRPGVRILLWRVVEADAHSPL